MSDAITAGHAFLAVMRRDLHVFLSYRTRIVSQAADIGVQPHALLLRLETRARQRLRLAPELLRLRRRRDRADERHVLVLLDPRTGPPGAVAGTFDRLLLSPFGAIRSVIAMTLFPLLYSFVLAALTLGLACALYGLQLHWSTVPLSVPAMGLALLAFLPFGLLFAALTVSIKQGADRDELGDRADLDRRRACTSRSRCCRTGCRRQPRCSRSRPRPTCCGTCSSTARRAPRFRAALIRLVAFAAVLLPLSIFALSSAIRLGQRRGTIIEY